VFEEAELSGEARGVDAACAGRLKHLLDRGDFAGRGGDTLLIADLPGIKASRVLLTGLGAKKKLSTAGAGARPGRPRRRRWARTRIASCAVAIDRPEAKQLDDYYFGRAVAELTGAALYRVNDLKTGKKAPAPALAKVLAGPVRKAAAAERGPGTRARRWRPPPRCKRDLANLPANVCTPTFLRRAGAGTRQALWLPQRCGCSTQPLSGAKRWAACSPLRRAAIKRRVFIVLEHRGARKAQPPVVLVGKGVTFDSGGHLAEGSPGMDEMKFDMSGAAR